MRKSPVYVVSMVTGMMITILGIVGGVLVAVIGFRESEATLGWAGVIAAAVMAAMFAALFIGDYFYTKRHDHLAQNVDRILRESKGL